MAEKHVIETSLIIPGSSLNSFEPTRLFVILHGGDLFITTSGLFVTEPGPDIFFRDYEVPPILRMLFGFGHHCYAVRVATEKRVALA